MQLSYQAVQRVAADTLILAFDDARNGDYHALAWLASRQAEPFFDLVNMPQSSFLARSGWVALARKAISTAHDDLAPDWADTLQASLDYLEELANGRSE